MARKLVAFGPQVKLISPQFVRPFVKGNKNDFVDAEAICEAASGPSTRFVIPKTESQQTLSALHRVLESLVRDRTARIVWALAMHHTVFKVDGCARQA